MPKICQHFPVFFTAKAMAMATMVMVMLPMNNTSKTDVAPWCYRWAGLDWMDWVGSLGGVKYRALFGANKVPIKWQLY